MEKQKSKKKGFKKIEIEIEMERLRKLGEKVKKWKNKRAKKVRKNENGRIGRLRGKNLKVKGANQGSQGKRRVKDLLGERVELKFSLGAKRRG